MNAPGPRRLLTFRLDTERRQRLRARLAREGRTMSEVVTHGLRQYVQHARHRDERSEGAERGDGTGRPESTGRPDSTGRLVLPERVATRLRELRSSGRSELLSVTLAALHEAGWPLRPLAEALGISKQAVQARVRRRAATGRSGPVTARPEVASEPGLASELEVASQPGLASELEVASEPPPPFPQRRVASTAGLRPHLTIKIDHALRASAHRVAADEGHSLTQVVEGILDRYLRQGMDGRDPDRDVDGAQAPRETSRAASRSR
jgi:antitoxin component of RelBE/YafQ-DinJ toxin-antitoxin module